ncbi:HAMP domain-containing sensor histidine kinase [Polyangium sp. y55x31]|uniref:sensor histidine kinase n=1 Tax=Polyangium sp. y55x31 TaxID=3042688 RepID=UPI002482D739|nr:HAMP domain-containing sensor histidine kinase [Polyangium sp. y55x31]MDI1480183.1 HAMP domain-containing sensor histidine kinase [Polyangium sp. y55x31]
METSILASLGKVVLERQPDGTFLQRGSAPDWYARMSRGVLRASTPIRVESMFPFLSVFLPEAEAVWRAKDGGPTRLDSDLWCETAEGGEELPLAATALLVGPSRLLVITRCDELFHERRLVLQRARELRITYDALAREIEQKDILVHCIVHDLASPLQTILGVLSSLDERHPPSEDGAMIDLALEAALRQRAMIREILAVFASEHEDLDATREETAVSDLRAGLLRVIAEHELTARGRNVRIERDVPRLASLVVADEPRLLRVLANLLGNAVRHSPVGGSVRVHLREEDTSVEVSIEDEGPGVPPALAPRLFQRFGRGIGPEAGTGLGLYFCRITVERWGGSIGYTTLAEGGARFWFRLRKAPTSTGALAA